MSEQTKFLKALENYLESELKKVELQIKIAKALRGEMSE